MKIPLLICSEQTHRGKVFHGRQLAIRVDIYNLATTRMQLLSKNL
jgi:hypothetical protein